MSPFPPTEEEEEEGGKLDFRVEQERHQRTINQARLDRLMLSFRRQNSRDFLWIGAGQQITSAVGATYLVAIGRNLLYLDAVFVPGQRLHTVYGVRAATPAARTVGHHADPKFLGGAQNQALTRLAEETHKNLHRDLNNFLRQRMDEFGNHMRPQRGNSGEVIRQNFSRQDRLEVLRDFYRGPGAQYTDAARDFFSQHPGL